MCFTFPSLVQTAVARLHIRCLSTMLCGQSARFSEGSSHYIKVVSALELMTHPDSRYLVHPTSKFRRCAWLLRASAATDSQRTSTNRAWTERCLLRSCNWAHDHAVFVLLIVARELCPSFAPRTRTDTALLPQLICRTLLWCRQENVCVRRTLLRCRQENVCVRTYYCTPYTGLKRYPARLGIHVRSNRCHLYGTVIS